ncbi:hypothetical protein GUJ93_ZPchr0004g39911 [Zizania palustris]|uniref:Uncharacterized protein n=1 Tax=Zizania palustris TaxID=103762 RepID=A0A8J5T1R8_ZIZPA|nr:hypothetical protein GUJ93_ZPchr0004g39911 [Zizania palustris]
MRIAEDLKSYRNATATHDDAGQNSLGASSDPVVLHRRQRVRIHVIPDAGPRGSSPRSTPREAYRSIVISLVSFLISRRRVISPFIEQKKGDWC